MQKSEIVLVIGMVLTFVGAVISYAMRDRVFYNGIFNIVTTDFQNLIWFFGVAILVIGIIILYAGFNISKKK